MIFKIISFDVEGTLITRRFSQVIWEAAIPKLYSETKGIGFEDAKKYIMNEYDKVGEDRIEWYDITYWFNHFGLSNPEKLLNEYKHEICEYPDVHQVLRALSEQHALIVTSNSPREFLRFQLEKIQRFFLQIFSAPSDFQTLKKTVTVYQRICGILGVKPEAVIHVGDRWTDDFEAPRKIGMVAYYLDREAEKTEKFVVKDLRAFKTRVEELEQTLPLSVTK